MKKIESIAEYQLLACRTCVDLGDFQDNQLHMNLGITSEAGEAFDIYKAKVAYKKPMDLAHLGEELGDLAWFIANKAIFAFGRNDIWKDMFRVTMETENMDAYATLTKEFEETFRSKIDPENNELEAFRIVKALIPVDIVPSSEEDEWTGLPDMVLLNIACELLGLDFFQVLTNNIEKLMVRYPEKFTEDCALTRDLEAEKAVLSTPTKTSRDEEA